MRIQPAIALPSFTEHDVDPAVADMFSYRAPPEPVTIARAPILPILTVALQLENDGWELLAIAAPKEGDKGAT